MVDYHLMDTVEKQHNCQVYANTFLLFNDKEQKHFSYFNITHSLTLQAILRTYAT